MLAEQRRGCLLELVRVRRFASLPELAEQLAVSESTVRRDLDQLEEQGVGPADARRSAIHGRIAQTAPFRCPAAGRMGKEAGHCRPGRAIDRGWRHDPVGWRRTTYELARLLVGRPLHVVTTSLPVANLFASDANSDLVLIGGNICPRTGVARGPYADPMLSMVRVRKTIFSVAAFRRRILQQRPAVGRDRAGDDARGRRGDRRRGQHQVRPPKPDPPCDLSTVPPGRR